MKNKKLLSILVAGLVLVAAGAILISKKNQKDEGDTPPPDRDSDSIIEQVDNKTLDSKFVQLYTDESQTMVGTADYKNLDSFRENISDFVETLNLKPIMTENGQYSILTGHKVYHSDESNFDYIRSGFGLYIVNDGRIRTEAGLSFLREEETGKRMYVVSSPQAIETMRDKWEKGVDILTGKTKGEKNSIIIDGFLTDYTCQWIDDEPYFNFEEVARFIDPNIYIPDDRGFVNVSPNEYYSILIPTGNANATIRETYDVGINTFKFRSWEGEKFEYNAPLMDADTMLISAKDASKMLGWRMYSDGKILFIVSDPINAHGLITMYNEPGTASMITKIEKDENGVEWAKTYDMQGNLISSEVFVYKEE